MTSQVKPAMPYHRPVDAVLAGAASIIGDPISDQRSQ